MAYYVSPNYWYEHLLIWGWPEVDVGLFGVDVTSMWGGCIEDMQIKRRQQVYISFIYYSYFLKVS